MDDVLKTMLLALLLCTQAYGQHIRGVLVNEEAEPVNFSLVSLYRLAEDYPLQQCFPSEQGSFSFEGMEAGQYYVKVEGGMGFQTYQSDTLTVKGDAMEHYNLGTITVAYQVQEGQTIVVEADAIKPLLEQDVDKTTMNIGGTSLSTVPSLYQILRLAPGVVVNGESITVNGKGKILLLVNGKRTNMTLERIPPSMIESIEIIANPSAEYDADVESAINVILKAGALEGIHGNAYANYTQGVYPRTALGASLDFNKKKFGLHVDVNYEYNKLRTISDVSRDFEATAPFYYSTTTLRQELMEHNLYSNLNLSWDFNDQHRIEGMAGVSFNRAPSNATFQEDAFTSSEGSSVVDSSLSNTTNTASTTNNFQFRLGYDGQLEKEWHLSSVVDYMQLNPYRYGYYQFGFDNALNPNQSFDFEYDMNDSTRAQLWVGRADLEWKKNNHEIKTGVQYTDINTFYSISFDNNEVQLTGEDNWFKYHEQIYALYGQWKGAAGAWQWRIGLRGEYSRTWGVDRQETETAWEQLNYFPSAAALFMPAEDHVFRLTYSKSIQRVGFFNQSPYQYYTGLYTNFKGNPALRPQITHSTALTYVLMHRFMFDAYHNEVIDYISQISEREGTLETFTPINFQNTNYGLSFTTQMYLSDWWQLSFKAAGIGIRTRGVNQGETFDNHSIYANLAWVQDFNCWDLFHLNTTFSYTSPYTVGIYHTGHLFFMDLNVYKTFANDQWTVGLYVSDVLGTNLPRNSVDFNTQQMQVVHNNDVRTVTLSLQYNFSKGRAQTDHLDSTIDDQTLDRVLRD